MMNSGLTARLPPDFWPNHCWITLLENRLKLASSLLSETGIICVAIDDEEVLEARQLLSSYFSKQIGIAVVRSNPQSRKAKGTFSPVHEYALFFGKSSDSLPGSLEITGKREDRYPYTDDKGRYAWMNFIRTGTADRRTDRPKMYYPIFVDSNDELRVPKIEWSDATSEYVLKESSRKDEVAVLPIVEKDEERIEKRWHRGYERIASEPKDYRVRRDGSGKISIDFKTRMDEDSMPVTWWDKNEYASANYGASELKELFGNKPFDFPKAKVLVEDCLRASGTGEGGCILDFFSGSGTTAHAIAEMTRKDGIRRKYILVECGEQFEKVTRPRTVKAFYSREWRDGRPVKRDGLSHGIKYIQLESYEDALNNLELRRTPQQERALFEDADVRERYVLSYMLDMESRGSQSLLNVDSFRKPDQYKLKVERNGETQLINVDLVETFNWLLGLTVKHIDVIQGVRVVEGTNPDGKPVLIVWRNLDETDNDALDVWFKKQNYNTRDQDYDLIYINGDSNLENLRRADQTWKVRLIEEEFQRLMFDVQDV